MLQSGHLKVECVYEWVHILNCEVHKFHIDFMLKICRI